MNSDDIRDIGFHKASRKWQVRVWNSSEKKHIYGGIHADIPQAQVARNKIYQTLRGDK
jgi:hypothetical protein